LVWTVGHRPTRLGPALKTRPLKKIYINNARENYARPLARSVESSSLIIHFFFLSTGHANSVLNRNSWREHPGRQRLHTVLQRRRTNDRTDHDNHVRSEQSAGNGRATDNGHAAENA